MQVGRDTGTAVGARLGGLLAHQPLPWVADLGNGLALVRVTPDHHMAPESAEFPTRMLRNDRLLVILCGLDPDRLTTKIKID